MLVNAQHITPAVTTEKHRMKPRSYSSEHENLSQDTITRLCSLLPWRLNPKLVLLDEVSSTGIINQIPRHLFLHASTATNASQCLLSSPLFLTSPRRQQKPEVSSRASIPFPTAGGKGGEELLPWWPFSTISEEENGSSKSDCTQPSTSWILSAKAKVHPSPGSCCPLVTSTLTCRRKSSNYQISELEDGETGLRKPQVPDVKWEGKTDILGAQFHN